MERLPDDDEEAYAISILLRSLNPKYAGSMKLCQSTAYLGGMQVFSSENCSFFFLKHIPGSFGRLLPLIHRGEALGDH
jgi:hypothetical protein